MSVESSGVRASSELIPAAQGCRGSEDFVYYRCVNIRKSDSGGSGGANIVLQQQRPYPTIQRVIQTPRQLQPQLMAPSRDPGDHRPLSLERISLANGSVLKQELDNIVMSAETSLVVRPLALNPTREIHPSTYQGQWWIVESIDRVYVNLFE